MIWVYLISIIFLIAILFIFSHYRYKNGEKVLRLWMIALGIIILCIPVINLIVFFCTLLFMPLICEDWKWVSVKSNKWIKFKNWLNKEI